MDLEGFCISVGFVCFLGKVVVSRVIFVFGIEGDEIVFGICVSLGWDII